MLPRFPGSRHWRAGCEEETSQRYNQGRLSFWLSVCAAPQRCATGDAPKGYLQRPRHQRSLPPPRNLVKACSAVLGFRALKPQTLGILTDAKSSAFCSFDTCTHSYIERILCISLPAEKHLHPQILRARLRTPSNTNQHKERSHMENRARRCIKHVGSCCSRFPQQSNVVFRVQRFPLFNASYKKKNRRSQ